MPTPPSYHFRRLVHFVGVHSQDGVPGAHEQHALGAVQEEGAEVGDAPELTWTHDEICAQKEKKIKKEEDTAVKHGVPRKSISGDKGTPAEGEGSNPCFTLPFHTIRAAD